MQPVTLIGYIAAVFTTGAMLPQIIHSWKRKHTKDISLWYYLVLCTGILLWLVYGIILKEPPIIAANLSALTLALIIVGLKLQYG